MLNLPLINCEVNLILTWSENCVITKIEVPGENPADFDNTQTGVMLVITDAKLYVPVVTFSTLDDNLLQQLKTWFKRTMKWNKYRSDTFNQTKNNHLNYLIDPAFNKVNR